MPPRSSLLYNTCTSTVTWTLKLINFNFDMPVLFREECYHRSNLRRGGMARWRPHGVLHANPEGDHTAYADRGMVWWQNHQCTSYLLPQDDTRATSIILISCYVHQQAVELCMDACSKLCEILRERLKDTAVLESEWYLSRHMFFQNRKWYP
jgi:hypothetical protein